MQNFKTLRQTLDHLEEAQLLEKLKASDPTGKWVSDFVDSDDPKFAGKSKKERIQMALGASYAAKQAEGKIKEEAEEFDEELTPMQNTHFELMNKHRVAAQFTNGPERDMHLTAAAKHERALRNHSSQDHSSSMTASKKLGVTEEAEQLDEIGDTPAGRKALASYAGKVIDKTRTMPQGEKKQKHLVGLVKSMDKMKKEETEIDEAMFPGTKEYEKKYGESPQQKLKKKGDTVPTSQGEMKKTEKGVQHSRRFSEMISAYQ